MMKRSSTLKDVSSIEKQICKFCVMDDGFFPLTFDGKGVCSVCRSAKDRVDLEWDKGVEGKRRLAKMALDLKEQGKGLKYDVMIGLSGGIDSAYLAHYATKEMGLRVLAVHVDGGWNSVEAVRNIRRMVEKLDIDLYTHVVEWDEMRDLQLAFLKAGVFNQDIPQDHAFFSTLFRVADKFKINYFLSGVNLATENIGPKGSGPGYMDAKHIMAIHKKFGKRPLSRYRIMPLWEYLWLTQIKRRPKVLKPLNLLDFNKDIAQELLKNKYGWEDYGAKHSESRWTKFYQEVYLPRKYDLDKRRLHLSSLIVSGSIKREQAMEILEVPITNSKDEFTQSRFISKKLNLSYQEFEQLMALPNICHMEYPNSKIFHDILMKIKRVFSKIIG